MDAELGRPSRASIDAVSVDSPNRARRLTTETKAAFKTTEQAWRLVSFLTIGYMVARGLAKSGSREPYDDRS